MNSMALSFLQACGLNVAINTLNERSTKRDGARQITGKAGLYEMPALLKLCPLASLSQHNRVLFYTQEKIIV